MAATPRGDIQRESARRLEPAIGLGLDLGRLGRADLFERAAWIADDGIAVVLGDRFVWSNPAFHSVCGLDPELAQGLSINSIRVSPFDLEVTNGQVSNLTDVLAEGKVRHRLSLRRVDGSAVAVEAEIVRPEATPDGHRVIRIREIAEHIRVDEALRTAEARFRALADHAPIGVFLSDIGVRLGFINAWFAQVWARPPEDLLGDRWLDSVHPADRGDLIDSLGRVLVGGEAEATIRISRPNGEERTLSCRLVPVVGTDRQAAFVGSVEDVTDARAREAELAWQAQHDALTSLPNRTALWEHLGSQLVADSGKVALLFFDIDDFKMINDSMGHAAGDDLLRVIARRLEAAVRGQDLVTRFGGDEFVVVCPEVTSDEEAKMLADRLLSVVREPVQLESRSVSVTASVGVLIGASGEADAETMLRDADVAMYQAKSAGKARAAVFSTAARHTIEHQLEIVTDLRRALSSNGVGVHYQPIIRHGDLHVIGAEALLRYVHPELGPIPANEVIAVAEASGCIDELGGYVLEQACKDLVGWRARTFGWQPSYVTVNLAASQLGNLEFGDHVHDVLRSTGLAPSDLCLELTESQLMTDVELATEVLVGLADRGVRLAIDDFGTGYSSLAYLRHFPVSLVKIDRGFVADADEVFVQAIIEAVVAVTHAVGGLVVAEGVETTTQLDTVAELGCSLIQGYLLGRPMPAAELPDSPDRTSLVPRT